MGYASDVFVGTFLLTMYGKCGNVVEAESIFSSLAYRDIVAWTAMLSTYVEQGQTEKALQFYASMQGQGVSPNQLTCTMALQACGINGEKEEYRNNLTKVQSREIGYTLHLDSYLRGFTIDVHVGTAIVTMYSKCGALMEAENVFGTLVTRDTVAFNAMFSTYVELQQGERAHLLYREMQIENAPLDDVTMLCLLQGCCEMGSLEMSRELHFAMVCAGHNRLFFIAATLIDAYGSCGSMLDVEAILDEIFETDLVSWTACLSGHAAQGGALASIKVLAEIVSTSLTPDDVVINLISSSCSHAGLVAEGVELFEFVNKDPGMKANVQHYGTIIDLLARAGDIKKVLCVLTRMPMQPDITIWLFLLGACHVHRNVELAEWVFDHAVFLQPHEACAYVYMSNAFVGANLPDLESI